MGQGAVGAALPRQGVEGACHEGTQEQQHFNLAKYSLCSSVDLRQMALNGKAETCRAKRWTPCREYPSTSTFYSTFCALVFPFPFCSALSPWARKTFDAKLLGHCRATSSLSSSGSESQSHSQFRSQCCYPLSFCPFLSLFVLSPPIRPSACHLPRCIVQTFIKL